MYWRAEAARLCYVSGKRANQNGKDGQFSLSDWRENNDWIRNSPETMRFRGIIKGGIITKCRIIPVLEAV